MRIAVALAVLTLAAASARADDASGTWLRDTGASRIRVAPCGDALCGSIVWLREPRPDTHNPDPEKAKEPLLGRRIFFDMKPNGANRWSGQAYNPEDGRIYTGHMSVTGNTLTTQGCALAGLVCRSVTWSRVN